MSTGPELCVFALLNALLHFIAPTTWKTNFIVTGIVSSDCFLELSVAASLSRLAKNHTPIKMYILPHQWKEYIEISFISWHILYNTDNRFEIKYIKPIVLILLISFFLNMLKPIQNGRYVWTQHHWSGNIVILMKFSPLAALEVVKMTWWIS